MDISEWPLAALFNFRQEMGSERSLSCAVTRRFEGAARSQRGSSEVGRPQTPAVPRGTEQRSLRQALFITVLLA